MRRRPQQVRDAAIGLREQGKSWTEIGRLVGVSATAVQQWYRFHTEPEYRAAQNEKMRARRRKRAGFCPSCGAQVSDPRATYCITCKGVAMEKYTEADKRRALALVDEGFNFTEAAKQTGISTTTIARWNRRRKEVLKVRALVH